MLYLVYNEKTNNKILNKARIINIEQYMDRKRDGVLYNNKCKEGNIRIYSKNNKMGGYYEEKILCTMMSMVMVASLFAGCGTDSGKENSASDTSKTKEAGTTISVAAIETAYGSEMWQKVADAFTEETGIKVELTTDKN